MKHSHILLSLSLAILLASCEESAPSLSTNIPTLNPVEVEDNGGLVFILKGTASNTPTINDCGFYISDNASMKDAALYPSKLTGNTFAAEVKLQGYDRKHYVCSYISNGRQEILSDAKTIYIGPLEDYVQFSTVSVNSYNRTTGKTSFSTTCSAAEGVNITKYGILWGTSEDLKTSGTSKELTFPADGKAFTFELPDLELGTQYYVCQYLTDSDVTAYGNTEKFKVYSFPIVELGDILNITSSSATVTGSVPDNGGALLQEKGIVYAEGDAIPTVETGKVISYDVSSDFSALLSGLSPNKEYTVRAYAKNSEGTSYSSGRKKFKTLVALPSVTTGSATSITSTAAVLNATLTSDGGETPSECGFFWSETSFTDPASATKVVSSLDGTSFSANLPDLVYATTYYYQAYAKNSTGISYGEVKSVTTSAILPSVTTATVSDITDNSATCGGTVTDDGGADVTKRGVVWSTSPNPTVSLSTKTIDGSGTGGFVSAISGLTRTTKYYVRAYATNSKGTVYGKEFSFSTMIAKATVATLSVISVTSESGIITACINDDGGETPSECGFYWSDCPFTDPALATKVISTLDGTSFSTTLSNLVYATTYYYQAYAKNNAGISYGEIKSFTTSAILPTVTTALVSDITDESATCGGTVTDDGGASVTNCGIVWSTSPNPTVSLTTKTVDGSGNGDFTSSITGLAPMTEYYVRAYATNSAGSSYGDERVFTTKKADFSSAQDLSSTESANCYIISSAGKYKFKTVKGNSTTSVGSVASCEVLWETFGTSTTPQSGDLVPYAAYNNGYIEFVSSSSKGNAVVAAKNASGNILWSWHIWMTDEPKGQVYHNNAGIMMDRNLGATSAIPGDVGALGLLYQWGRKDPFLGSSSTSSSIQAKSNRTWPSPVSSSSSTGKISYTIAHPTTFITGNDSNFDWYYNGVSSVSSTDNTRWQSTKTIYDPCPAGWRVPDGGSSGVWATAFGRSTSWSTSSNWDSTNKGMDFSVTDKTLGSSGPIWYPAPGNRSASDGGIYSVGNYGGYWSVSPRVENAYTFSFGKTNILVVPMNFSNRASGESVRCLKE